jgi:putative tryptophan/tyrosine transport system substrate-binding protein
MMKRREFITLLGGVAAAWPLAGRAQQSSMPVVGFLSTRTPNESAHVVAAFRRGLADNGYVEGQNVAVEYRWALGLYDRLPGLAAELARLRVAVLAATGGDPAALAAKAATATIPVVATFSADPVARGLVASLSRPGGNVTGVNNLTSTLEAKRFGLLRELVPQATTIGVVLNPTWPLAVSQLRDMQEAAHFIGVQIHILHASSDLEIDTAFESASQQSIPALVVAGDAFLNTRRDRIAALATRHAVPAMYSFRDYAVAGGLMSYGIDLPDVYRQVGIQAGRILKGASPADLPVVQPTKFEFVINLKAAKTLGLNFPPGLLAIADEVIE